MKIGKRVKAKKYKSLREKQAIVNKKMKQARARLGKDHREIEKIKSKKKTFFNKRGIKNPSQFSFKNLSKEDIKAYEELLDSVINDFETNTYLNEEKYEELRERLEEQFNEQWGDIPIPADDLIDILESDIIDQLKELGIPYVSIFDMFEDYTNISKEDMLDALKDFLKAYREEDTTADDFLKWTDDYLTIRNTYGKNDHLFNLYNSIPEDIKDINIFNDALKNYTDDGETGDFLDYYKQYYDAWG